MVSNEPIGVRSTLFIVNIINNDISSKETPVNIIYTTKPWTITTFCKDYPTFFGSKDECGSCGLNFAGEMHNMGYLYNQYF